MLQNRIYAEESASVPKLVIKKGTTTFTPFQEACAEYLKYYSGAKATDPDPTEFVITNMSPSMKYLPENTVFNMISYLEEESSPDFRLIPVAARNLSATEILGAKIDTSNYYSTPDLIAQPKSSGSIFENFVDATVTQGVTRKRKPSVVTVVPSGSAPKTRTGSGRYANLGDSLTGIPETRIWAILGNALTPFMTRLQAKNYTQSQNVTQVMTCVTTHTPLNQTGYLQVTSGNTEEVTRDNLIVHIVQLLILGMKADDLARFEPEDCKELGQLVATALDDAYP